MPFELSVIPNDPVARVRGWGDENFESTLASIHRISTDPRLPSKAPLLMAIARAFASKAGQAQPGARIEVFVEPHLADTWLRENR